MTWNRTEAASRIADAACARYASRCVDQDARQESEAQRRALLAAKRPAALVRLAERRERTSARHIAKNTRISERYMRKRDARRERVS